MEKVKAFLKEHKKMIVPIIFGVVFVIFIVADQLS